MQTVKLKGLNRRGKSRISTYSDDGTFKLVDRTDEVASFDHKGDFILVEAFKRNFKLAEDHFVPWGGWLEVGVDVEIVMEELRMKNAVKMYYVGERNGDKHDGVMTIATEVMDNGMLKVGVAFCSKKDRFVKSVGRLKAMSRMRSKAFSSVVPFSGNSANDIIGLINDDEYPKPQLWRHRRLIRHECSGLSYYDSSELPF